MEIRSTYNVENVSALLETDGEAQTIKLIFPLPLKASLKTLVSFEFRKGMWVLDLSIKAEMQCPRVDKLPLIEVNSCICSSRSSFVKSLGILNFSDPAKSTIFNYYRVYYFHKITDDSTIVASSFGSTETYCKVI